MALELRPKKAEKGHAQKWIVRLQLPTGKRNAKGKVIYKNWTRVIGERGKMTKAQAQEIHDRLKLKMKPGTEGEYLIESPPLIDFAPEFIEHKKEVDNIRSVDRYVHSIKHLLSFFGHAILLSELTPKKIDDYKAHRLKSVAPGTVNRELQCLRAMINLAEKWNQFQGRNPVSKAGLIKEVRDEIVPVNQDEEVKLLGALHLNISLICEFALNTGMRVEEILQLKEKAIQHNKIENMFFAKIEATEQKGKRFREVPLNDRAMELLEEARQFKKKFKKAPEEIFLNSKGVRYSGHDSIYPTVIRACKKLGLRKINPHLFRHTFITRLIERGADPISVQEIVGHANIKTLLRYTHLRSSKFNAVNLLGNAGNKGKSAA
jgi:integrase